MGLLNVSSVGLYEFLWMLRGAYPEMREEALRHHAEKALESLLASRAGKLVWLEWPGDDAVDQPMELQPDPARWDNPEEGSRYIALGRV